MRNFEFYEKEIKNTLHDKNQGLAMIADTNKMTTCGAIDCCKCAFSSGCGRCTENMFNWLYKEYSPKINKRTKMFLDSLEIGYIARDSDGDLFYYTDKPKRNEVEWIQPNDSESVELYTFKFLTLDFIKWEDKEPWSVEDLRKLEVCDD